MLAPRDFNCSTRLAATRYERANFATILSVKIFLAVGDLSGDLHCAALVHELLRRHPDWQIHALAGPNTRAAGAHILGDTSGLGVIGFSSALAVVPRSLKLKKHALKWIEAEKPAAAILCDWGGFNTRILPDLNGLKIPVLYYFPPRSWQKSGDGGLQIAPFCARIATPFSWSAQRLNDAGGNAEWVGHPILERLQNAPSRDKLRAEFGVEENQTLIALLPGSRGMELRSIAPHVARARQILARNERRFLVAAAPGATAKLRQIFGADAQIIEGRTFDILRAADFALVKSGTSTLEAAIAGCPQIVVYDAPRPLHWQAALTGARKKIPFVGMPNIIAGRAIIPEILGDDCRAPNLARAAESLLSDQTKLDQMRAAYAAVRTALGADLPRSATARTAALVEDLVGKLVEEIAAGN